MTITRHDRIDQKPFDLPPPEVRPDGSLLVHLALAYPGVREYPDGIVYTPPEVLASEALHRELPGTQLIDDDTTPHAQGVEVDEPTRLGTLLDARWDEEQQALVGRAVIDTSLGLQRIKKDGKIGVSLAYGNDEIAEEGVTPDGMRYTLRETSRHSPDNIALTYKPRAARAHLRPDSTGGQTMEDMDPKPDAAPHEGGGMMSEALMSALSTMIKDAIKEAMAPAPEPEVDDAEDEDMGPTMADARAVIDAADSLSIDIEPTTSLRDARLAVARQITGRADSEMSDEAASLVVATASKLRADAKQTGQWPTRADGGSPEADRDGIPSTAFRL